MRGGPLRPVLDPGDAPDTGGGEPLHYPTDTVSVTAFATAATSWQWRAALSASGLAAVDAASAGMPSQQRFEALARRCASLGRTAGGLARELDWALQELAKADVDVRRRSGGEVVDLDLRAVFVALVAFSREVDAVRAELGA